MARLIPAAERISRAKKLIQKARAVPPPPDTTVLDLAYMAEVRDLLQQARDLIKFITYTPSASEEQKRAVTDLFAEADQTERALLHRKPSSTQE